MIRAAAIIALLAAAATPVSAQTTTGQKANAPGTTVEDVVVVAGPGPTVSSTYPATGSSVPGGVLILKIVFDQPMQAGEWAYGPAADGDFPKCLADPRLLADQRTYVLLCSVPASHSYAVQINPDPRFHSAAGRSAKPFTLTFTTTGDMTIDMHDALANAGLADTDDPIMTWRDPGKGVSQTAAPSE
jgi:hypothetical protein